MDSFRLLVLDATVHGIAGQRYQDLDPEWRERLAGWLRAGELTVPRTVLTGIEQAPGALSRLIGGDLFGVLIVELTD